MMEISDTCVTMHILALSSNNQAICVSKNTVCKDDLSCSHQAICVSKKTVCKDDLSCSHQAICVSKNTVCNDDLSCSIYYGVVLTWHVFSCYLIMVLHNLLWTFLGFCFLIWKLPNHMQISSTRPL